jgi:hypothetical protein
MLYEAVGDRRQYLHKIVSQVISAFGWGGPEARIN